jgi:ubiquinone/menaquinone biosynthesis C-methylase UbiE
MKQETHGEQENEWAEGYESETWKLETRRGEHVLNRRLEAVLPVLLGSRLVVDVGVGPATMSRHFPCEVIGCDRSLPMVKRAKKRITEVVLADADYLPFRDKAFDGAFESGCLPYVADRVQAVREMARVSSGRVVTFESNRWSLRRIISGRSSAHPSPPQLESYHTAVGLRPSVRLVGFAPFVRSRFVFAIWRPIEKMIERIPLLRSFCGGILVYSENSREQES